MTRSERRAHVIDGTPAEPQWASDTEHVRYSAPSKGRHRCSCGCGQRSTHQGCANGMALMGGCELHVMRWVRAQGRR